jgi:hypothetical protein
MGWWIAVPVGIALGLLLAMALDRAAAPAAAAGEGGYALTVSQLKTNQVIAQQGVRRANRANARLDALGTAARGPAGPAGPAGPGASRIAYSAPAGSPAQTALSVDGLTVRTACTTGAGGETQLEITGELAAPADFVGTAGIDGGTDPANPAQQQSGNFQNSLPAGTSPLGTVPAADGTYLRIVANAIVVMPSRTISIQVAEFADGINDRCSFNGVAVPAG